ncbi:MAG: dTDP-4-dehydrorhamnose 3,5-epimerase family protein [Rikenellaceae bacterium]
MLKFIVKETPTIEGPKIIRPNEFGASREWLTELEPQEVFAEMGLEETFVQLTGEKMARGVMRGLYFQRKDSYSRLVGVVAGRALAVVVDLRPESKSFGAANSVELSAENEALLYVPQYFAYGFLTLEPATEVVCLGSGEIDPESEAGITYDDEILAIDWQFERYEIDERRLSMAQMDKKFPSFRSYNQNTLWINRPKKSKYALSRERVIKIV